MSIIIGNGEIRDGKLVYSSFFSSDKEHTVPNVFDLELLSQEVGLLTQDSCRFDMGTTIYIALTDTDDGEPIQVENLSIEDLKPYFPQMVKIDAMSLTYPANGPDGIDLLQEIMTGNNSLSENFRHKTLSETSESTDHTTKYGFPQQTLILPSAVREIQDMGLYRSIILSDDYNPYKGGNDLDVWTSISAQELLNTLGVDVPVTNPPQPQTQELN